MRRFVISADRQSRRFDLPRDVSKAHRGGKVGKGEGESLANGGDGYSEAQKPFAAAHRGLRNTRKRLDFCDGHHFGRTI